MLVALSGVVVVVVIALCAWGLGRRRLGYRVQMDCDLSERFPADHTGVLRELGEDGRTLHQPSMVLVRIENAGSTGIRPEDYASPADDQTGLRITFPGRRVRGFTVTEFSNEALRHLFLDAHVGLGLGANDGVIRLPRVPMGPRDHYKVLAVLERDPGAPDAFVPAPEPRLEGGVIRGSRGRRGAVISADAAHRRVEGWRAVWLAVGAGVAYLVAYLAGRPVLDSIESDQLGPSETAQVIAALGALGSAIGMSTAAIIKSVALLTHARADMLRARSGQPSTPRDENPAAEEDQA